MPDLPAPLTEDDMRVLTEVAEYGFKFPAIQARWGSTPPHAAVGMAVSELGGSLPPARADAVRKIGERLWGRGCNPQSALMDTFFADNPDISRRGPGRGGGSPGRG